MYVVFQEPGRAPVVTRSGREPDWDSQVIVSKERFESLDDAERYARTWTCQCGRESCFLPERYEVRI